jgi:hypothetical protein
MVPHQNGLPMSEQVVGPCLRQTFAARAGKQSRETLRHEYIWRPVTDAPEQCVSLSKDSVVTWLPADGRRLTKSGGAMLLLTSRAILLASMNYGEAIPSHPEIALLQPRNLLVLWALAGRA